MDQGFCGIPVTTYNFKQKDNELLHLENYLIKMQYYKDSRSKNVHDFGALMQIYAPSKASEDDDKSFHSQAMKVIV